MMLVLGNGRVVTRDASCPFIEDGAVAVEDTKIRRVGKTQDIRSAYPDAEYIDAKGGLIMPAFINFVCKRAFHKGLRSEGIP